MDSKPRLSAQSQPFSESIPSCRRWLVLSAQRASKAGASSHAELPSTVTSLPRSAVPSRLASHLRLMSGLSTAPRTPAASKPTTPAFKADRTRRRLPSQPTRSRPGRSAATSDKVRPASLPLPSSVARLYFEPRCPEICTFLEPIPGCREAVDRASCRRGL
jgi:hypothetical protein